MRRLLSESLNAWAKISSWQVSRSPGIPSELLWFPYFNADGAIASWTARIFPTPANGPKFLTPKGGNGAPYITPGVWVIADKADVPLILTEGPCKTSVVFRPAFLPVGLNGVYGACCTRFRR